MDTLAFTYFLCGQPARLTETDHGNRNYVACSSVDCGDYEISKRAARSIAAMPQRRDALKASVVQSNIEGKVLQV